MMNWMRSRLEKPVILHFGPYWAWGTMKHRTQRLYGLITKLEELGYSVMLDPYEMWDQLEITVNEVIVFRCRQTFLKYNCEHDEDPVCRRAVEAVIEMYPKIITAAEAVEEVKEVPLESHPAAAVLRDLIYSLPLPETPVEEVLRILLESLPLIDTIPEAVLYSLLKSLWLSDSVPEGLILELVRKIPTYAPETALSSLMDSVMESAAKYPPHALLRELLRRLPLPTKCKCRDKKYAPQKIIPKTSPLVCRCKSLSDIDVSETRVSKTRMAETARSDTAISEMRASENGVIETGVSETAVGEMGVSETDINETGESETGMVEMTESEAGVVEAEEDIAKVSGESETLRHDSWQSGGDGS